jgi:PST family polysaccharide transporter
MTAQNSSAISSTKWTILSSVINGVLTIIIGAVLARLLTPEIYGLVAIAYIVIAFAGYFVRLGVGTALVQKEDLNSEDINFAISLSMGISFISAIIMVLLAPIIATLFTKPESNAVIAVMSLSLWFSSFSSTLIGLLRRNMLFNFLSIVSIAQTIFTGIFSITMAWLGSGVWSLVWPLIIGQIIVLIVFFMKVKNSFEYKFRFSFSGQNQILKFGSKYTLISILEYFGSNLDTIFIGRFFSAGQLGLYDRAYKLAYLPSQTLITSITSVMFPVFSRLQTQMEKFKETQNRLFLFIGLLSTCIAMGMVPASRDIVLVLFGPQWLGSVPILKLLLFAVPFDFMAASLGLTFDATNKLKEKIKIQIIAVLTLLIGIFFFYKYGPIGIALAITLCQLIRFLIYTFYNQKIFSLSIKLLLRNSFQIILAGTIVFNVSQFAVAQSTKLSFSPLPSLGIAIFPCLIILLSFIIFNARTFLGVESFQEGHSKVRAFLGSKGENNGG